ncbi:hypothetical protein D030_4560B, partial [Vibrio parahaemolyticus AQ3810]
YLRQLRSRFSLHRQVACR